MVPLPLCCAALQQQPSSRIAKHLPLYTENTALCRAGGLSEPAAAACRQLRSLEPQEAAGVMAWLLDELYSGGPAVYNSRWQCSCTRV